MPSLSPRRRTHRVRRALLVVGVVGVVAGAAWMFLWVPKAAAVAFLQVLAADLPTMDDIESVGGRIDVEGGRRSLVVPGPTDDALDVVLVAGVTQDGVQDPRLLRLALALRAAGHAVRAPEVPGLMRLGEDDDLVEPVVAAWRTAIEQGRGRRTTFLGVSVGAGVVLRALARGRADDPDPASVAALLLVGPPDDTTTLARGWFRRSSAPSEANAMARAQAAAGRFARRGIARAAATHLVREEELVAVRQWLDALGEAPIDRGDAPGLASEEAVRLVRTVTAEDAADERDVTWILAAAAPFLASCSPAAVNDARRWTSPVFIIHGVDDPLVPLSEGRALLHRLGGHTSVECLESRLLAHVEVDEAGWVDRWEHLAFAQRFFDAARAR